MLNPPVTERLIRAVKRERAPRVYEEMIGALRSERPRTRQWAIFGIEALRHDRWDALAPMLRDASKDVRAAACAAIKTGVQERRLGKRKQLLGPVGRLLADPVPGVRGEAAQNLLLLAGKAAIKDVKEACRRVRVKWRRDEMRRFLIDLA